MTDPLTLIETEAQRYANPIPKTPPSEWCVANLRFDEEDNRGPYSFAGSEYCIETVNDFANPDITDEILVWGSQTRKTGTLMGGAAWAAVNDPCGFLWVMPNRDLASLFTQNRWMPFLEASPGVCSLLPVGHAKRTHFKSLDQRVGASGFLWAGSNSVANLSSTPRRRVIQDEVDKFCEGGREANAADLADQRTKQQANPQRWKTSTPSIPEGLIWQEALKGDLRRFAIPCHSCGKRMLLAWSAQYVALPKTGLESYVVWDKEAKRNGVWDEARVLQSTRVECCHCGFHNLDSYKTLQVREGVWMPTKAGPANIVSRHLSSLYSCAPQTTYGALAVKFLRSKNSLLGLQGFINGDLAEPYTGQDTLKQRTELITNRVEVTAEWRKLLTVDCQEKSPRHWYVVRQWADHATEGIEAGPCDSFDDIAEIQKKHDIADACVAVDSGWGAVSDADVYQACAARSTIDQLEENGKAIAVAIGWVPSKGFTNNKRWRDAETKAMLPYNLARVDPFTGTAHAGLVTQSLFEFSGDFFKDIITSMRAGKGPVKWSVLADVATDEYWRHMDGEVKKAVFNARTGHTTHIWTVRSKHWPNHLFDCEVLQVAFAVFHKLFTLPV